MNEIFDYDSDDPLTAIGSREFPKNALREYNFTSEYKCQINLRPKTVVCTSCGRITTTTPQYRRTFLSYLFFIVFYTNSDLNKASGLAACVFAFFRSIFVFYVVNAQVLMYINVVSVMHISVKVHI